MRIILGIGAVLLAGCASQPQRAASSADPVQTSAMQPTAERSAAIAALSAARQSRDWRHANAIMKDWAARHPTDLEFRRDEPLTYLLAEDLVGWEHARADLLREWSQIKGTVQAPKPPSFMIDLFKAGPDMVVATQCYESAGRFGVSYRFTVFNPDRQSRSFFTVESPISDNQIARELGRRSPVFTLDHFRPGIHETVATLSGPPEYQDLRRRVLNYVANPRPISASGNGVGMLSTEDCEVSDRPNQ
jgi:hypothetical protein